ncbi:tRNA uridine-5-carboxymethylaminomethyl(34) synthesis GTPase MnmE [Selenomonas sp. KH1T6]|uniref:tRNA uridine-5-carboxymethylaminomethyl(34) synthesis GTPase MnmE n=1 Tax=Selenomonas sp. KH1T6 TaxID=3158784 RepID=UPI0008A73984|nr:tRNA modification GTPase [Selenomonas ruminantium]
MYKEDTIAAIATAPGAGGIGIIRLSGKKALEIADKVFVSPSGKKPTAMAAYTAAYGKIIARDGSLIDEAIALIMRAPKSYTCEDVVELQCHGGPMALRSVLRAVFEAGARPAEPGEFTKRAFLNGRLDLSEAQAVMDVINAKTDMALRQATGHLTGSFSSELQSWRREILGFIAHLEALIDFPEEGVEEAELEKMRGEIEGLSAKFSGLISTASTGRILREGLMTAIIGKPNVGKSSLLNALLREERAIVTDIPGTTRDAIEEYADLEGVPLRIIDTAGIRETSDTVEQLGVEKSKEYIEKAQLVLALFDSSRPLDNEDKKILSLLQNQQAIALLTKNDLPEKLSAEELQKRLPELPIISISTKGDKDGLADLARSVHAFVFKHGADPQAAFLRDEEEAEILKKARHHLQEAISTIDSDMGLDFISIDLRSAWEALGELTGEALGDDIVDEVFKRFCIGK